MSLQDATPSILQQQSCSTHTYTNSTFLLTQDDIVATSDVDLTIQNQQQQQQKQQQQHETLNQQSCTTHAYTNNTFLPTLHEQTNELTTANPDPKHSIELHQQQLQQQHQQQHHQQPQQQQRITQQSWSAHTNSIFINSIQDATTTIITADQHNFKQQAVSGGESSKKPQGGGVASTEKTAFILYTRRWVMLTCYCFLSLVCGSSWLCFPAVSNIIRKFYNINLMAVNLLSIIFGIAVVLLSVPFALFLDRFGLSATLKTSAALNVAGAIIKYFGDDPERGYWFLLCGNTFTAISVAGFLFLPGKIATSWFGDKEIGKATSICMAFDALGTGIGFLHATIMIKNNEDHVVVQGDIKTFLLSQLVPAFLVFIFVMVMAKDHPKTPPNQAELRLSEQEAKQRERHKAKKAQRKIQTDTDIVPAEADTDLTLNPCYDESTSFKNSIWKLLKNGDFQLIIHIQGVVASVEGLYEILLNEMLIEHYPGKEKAIGVVGFVSVLLGFASNIVIGVIVDKTGSYRKISFVIFFLTTLLSLVWCLLLEYVANFMAKAVVFCALMAVSTSYYTIAFSHSTQVANSVSSATMGVVLVLTSQVYDIATSFAGTEILAVFGPTAVNVSAIVICAIGTTLTFFVKDKRTDTPTPAEEVDV